MEANANERLAAWRQANNDFLSAALNWLRLSIRQRLPEIRAEEVSPPAAQQRERAGLFRRQPQPAPVVKAASVLHTVSAAEVEDARQAMDAAALVDPPTALHRLGQLLGLSPFEQEILLLCAALEIDPDIADLYARLPGRQPYPTFALARQLFADPGWDALAPDRPLRYFHQIEINQPAAQPLTTSPLRADERIVSYLKGLNYLDDRLSMLFLPMDAAAYVEGSLSPSQMQLAEVIRMYIAQAQPNRAVLVQLAGPDGLSKQLIAAQVARSLSPEIQLVRLPAEWLPTQAAELETLARLWERERALLGLGLYLEAGSVGEGSPEGSASPLPRFLGRIGGVILLDTRDIRPEMNGSILELDIEKPNPAEQAQAWQESLAMPDSLWPARLAGQFNLNLPTIAQVSQLAQVEGQAAESADSAEPADIAAQAWRICLMRTRPQLDQLAQRIEAKASWEDLQLPPETKNLLDEICDQVENRLRVYDQWRLREVMNRGLGISALFAGESGTGKTLAAEVMARRLNLNLYRIDLSAVVSKYIGETEKNLRKLFDAAEDGGALLFFDEADALFGKRSEVKDSHDRYANIEVNYLLQRMEAYRGLAILATNMKNALDQAFTRRLRFIVTFPFPGVEWRKRIWQGAFPPPVPRDDLDLERLARFNLTGGSIRNAAVNAIFLAAGRTAPVVTMDLALQAVRSELRKLEKPISEADYLVRLNEAERQALWQRAFSPDAPWKPDPDLDLAALKVDELDFARLARHELTPSGLYDLAARAVQQARAQDPPQLTTAAMLQLIRADYEAQGKAVKAEDFEP